ncbi:hypothetical protein [Methylobacterium sp. Leaf85]|uniref:hypothetical protein n=1 Tax=Methylobacterium sp. Leaf85 TaxID=1736241 RepID=UPI0012E8610B|nr:hypothetical protein [Methylobacterium sp. Leaf85]
MQLAGIHSQLDALVLDLREMGAQLGVLGRQSEQKQSVGNGWPPGIEQAVGVADEG